MLHKTRAAAGPARRGRRHGERAAPDPTAPGPIPLTGEPLVVTPRVRREPGDRRTLSGRGGIPRLFVPTDGASRRRDVTEIVKQFYEKTPFPELRRPGQPAGAAGEGAGRACSPGC